MVPQNEYAGLPVGLPNRQPLSSKSSLDGGQGGFGYPAYDARLQPFQPSLAHQQEQNQGDLSPQQILRTILMMGRGG